MRLFASHQISFSLVRQQAIKCYALDLAAKPLLLNGVHSDADSATRVAYEELFSKELLAFAITMRTKFYQGLDPSSSEPFISASGLLYVNSKNGEESKSFTVKDVCDKIIHAIEVEKFLELNVSEPTTTLRGAYKNEKWEFSFSATLFFEGLLNWLDTCAVAAFANQSSQQ